MHVEKENDFYRIVLPPAEASILKHCFVQIFDAYRVKPDELPEKIEEVWYQSASHQTIADEDAHEWAEHLYKFRGENCKNIEKWIAILSSNDALVDWRLPSQEIDSLLTVVNDYRLYRGAEWDISQADMESDFNLVANPRKRLALLEIHFLGWLMELLLKE